ncbi:unnamed protein product, partial [Choristocarpus tenellus]
IVGSKTLRDVLGFEMRQFFEEAARRKTELHIADLEQGFTSMQRMSVSVEVMEKSMGTAHLDRGDDSILTLLEQGPELMMDHAEEGKKRGLVLETSFQKVQRAGIPLGAWGRLQQVIPTRTNVFRVFSGGDPPAKVKPIQVMLKEGATHVKAQPRASHPEQHSWMAGFVGLLVVLGMLRWIPQDVWSNPSLPLPK